MASKKIQLYTDRANTIEASPETSANCVILSDGNDLQKVLDNDLTNPTVVHEETSFKVGVGDIDVSGSIVDGEVGRMVIKGQTYQNILPEPSLRNSMTNGKTMQKLNEGCDSVSTVDGVCKSAILKGQTLVNSRGNTVSSIGWSTTDGIEYIVKGTNSFLNFECALLPNTKYLIFFEFDGRGASVQFGTRPSNGGWDSAHIVTTDGICKKVITTGSDSKWLSFIVPNTSPVTDYVKISRIMIITYQQGMENWDIPYFEGMQSVKMPVLKTVGKNLFNLENSKMNEKSSYDMKFNIYGYWTYIVKLKPNTTYTISRKNTDGYGKGFMFRINTKFDYIDAPWIVASHSQNENRQQKTVTTGTDGYLYFFVNNNLEKINNLLILCDYIQVEEGSTATPYEPFKSNILSTSEEVVLRGIGDVRDELDLVTGEVTERIDEVVLDGSERWSEWRVSETSYGFALRDYKIDFKPRTIPICDILPSINYVDAQSQTVDKGIALYTAGSESSYSFFIRLPKTECTGLEDFKTKIQQNPITVQYQLATESIKTVDLSSSGNWEKVVLDGSDNENWGKYSSGLQDSDKTKVYYMRVDNLVANWSSVVGLVTNSTKYAPITGNRIWNSDNIGITNDSAQIIVRCDVRDGETVDRWKQYLQQNPITVWYQTTVSQENSIREMLSFANGHVQLSSAEGSLIPSLNYETPTSNSYQLDLAKTNTKYTMKSSSANGNFTIDGTQYNFNTNGTFTTPSTMNNKLMIANGTVTDLMFIEGDVTSKTIPYFKGIKSAFEDEDKIEVLSTSKNLLSPELYVKDNVANGVAVTVKDSVFTLNGTVTNYHDLAFTPNNDKINLKLEKGKRYRVSLNHIKGSTNYSRGIAVKLTLDDGTIKWLGSDISASHLTMNGKISWIRMTPYEGDAFNDYTFTLQVEESPVPTSHEPYKSNNTKIPLLSPLRSLPNGVYDELIIDRMKKKATLIQRIGYSVINSEFAKNGAVWNNTKDTDPCFGFHCGNYVQGTNMVFNQSNTINNILPFGTMSTTGRPLIGYYKTNPHLAVNRNEASTLDMAKKWLDRNPINLYYQLETPIVTEIDLESFPLVYKDGHIFLNSEIAPVVEIDYNINQSQQIQSNNETLQRHELDILDLDNLIVSFVNAEYNLRLLKFDMELSMMALAE